MLLQLSHQNPQLNGTRTPCERVGHLKCIILPLRMALKLAYALKRERKVVLSNNIPKGLRKFANPAFRT